MKEKELRRLSRADLLEMLIDQSKEMQELKEKENTLLMQLSMADEEENQDAIMMLTENLMEIQRKIRRKG